VAGDLDRGAGVGAREPQVAFDRRAVGEQAAATEPPGEALEASVAGRAGPVEDGPVFAVWRRF